MLTAKGDSVNQLIYSCAKDNFSLVSRVIIIGIVSRIAEIVSFLLPVKALLVAATEKIPAFFPEILHQYNYRVVVVAMALVSTLFYAISYILKKYIEEKAEKSAMTKLRSTLKSKNVSDKKISKIATRIFRIYIESFFILPVAIFISTLFPYLLLPLIPYYVYVVIVIRREIEKKPPKPTRNPDKQDDVEYNFSIYSDIGFIIGFFTALVISFQADNVGIMYLVICFVLLKRSQGSVKRLINDYVFLKVRLIQAI